MSPKSDEKESITEARIMWQNRFESIKNDTSIGEKEKVAIEKECATCVLSSMSRFMLSETSILNSLIRYPRDYKRAFLCITKTMRMMFIHAFQSFVWNQAVSYRIKELGLQVAIGDLVFSKCNEFASPLERNANHIPSVHVVTKEDVTSKKYTLFDIVMPLIGMRTKNPENKSGDLFSEILLEHGITLDMIHAMAREYNCAGDYRKVVCQPTDIDFRILEYCDELEPLLQTDYMLLQNIEVKSKTILAASPDRTTKDITENLSDPSSVDESNFKNVKSKLYSMVVGFTLPSSSYATIFLRELMKRPTSGEYQKEQKLNNDVVAD
jgi:tRNA pseudouridine13 synthase